MEQLLAQLQSRAQAILTSEKKDYTEMGAVHKAITGVGYDCTPCNERRILFTLNSFVNQPERYALRIQEAAKEMEQNTTTNYRFSKKATGTNIVLIDANGNTILVTPQNLTDEKAELVLKHKAFAHNIERIPGTEPTGEDKGTETGEGLEGTDNPDAGTEVDPTTDTSNATENTSEQGTEPTGELSLEQARVRYHELTGNKAGTRNLKTLLTAIAEAEAAKA